MIRNLPRTSIVLQSTPNGQWPHTFVSLISHFRVDVSHSYVSLTNGTSYWKCPSTQATPLELVVPMRYDS